MNLSAYVHGHFTLRHRFTKVDGCLFYVLGCLGRCNACVDLDNKGLATSSKQTIGCNKWANVNINLV